MLKWSRKLQLVTVVAFLVAGWTLWPAWTQPAFGDASSDAPQLDSLARGWDQVSRGRFHQATDTFREAAQSPDAEPRVRNISDWLAAYEEIRADREKLRAEEFDLWQERAEAEIVRMRAKSLLVPMLKPVILRWIEQEEQLVETADAHDPEDSDKAEESRADSENLKGKEKADDDGERLLLLMSNRIRALTKGDGVDERSLFHRIHDGFHGGVARVHYRMETAGWIDTLGNAFYAFLYAADQKEFQDSAWMESLTQAALTAAQQKRHEEKWLEASGIYYQLERIFDREPGYKRQREACQTHARLETLYAKEGNWERIVRGADPDLVSNALARISRSYVRTPDFTKVVVQGLESVGLIAETPALMDVFESLNDDLDRATFKTRLDSLIRKASDENKLSARAAIRQYWQRGLLKINRETLQLPEQVLAVEFMEGALRPLDQFSSMIWPSEVTDFKKYTTGEFTGVGIQINVQGEYITVFSPLEDSPAYEAGVRPGDKIIRIDGEDARGINVDEAVDRITGPAGTEVTLTIRHEDDGQEVDLVLKRAKILIQTVKGVERLPDGVNWDYMLDSDVGIGYVRLSGFNETTVPTLNQALHDLEARQARGLIIDLRSNPGGLLSAAWQVADLLLPANQLIVRTGGRTSPDWEKMSRGDYADMPLVVLVDERSASASEIVSGAIKDHKRGLIVGERTFGKGSVQNLIPLADNDALLKLTTAYYYLPSGRCLQREEDSEEWGVEPDLEVRLLPKEISYVRQIRRKTDVIKRESDPAITLEDDEPLVDAHDAQLETALLMMRIRLTGGTDWRYPNMIVAAKEDAKETGTIE